MNTYIKVNDLPTHSGYVFVSDSQDVQPIKDYVGRSANKYDSFFVLVGEGEYIEVWGMMGIVPWLNNTLEFLYDDGTLEDY